MKTTWIISRHPAAIIWLANQGHTGIEIDHLDIEQVQSGDTVIGTLPVNMAAEVCAIGAAYIHLSLKLPLHKRGVELSIEEMQTYGATLQQYTISAN